MDAGTKCNGNPISTKRLKFNRVGPTDKTLHQQGWRPETVVFLGSAIVYLTINYTPFLTFNFCLRPSTFNCKLEKVKSQKICTFNIIDCTISYSHFKPSTVSSVIYIPYTVILTGHGFSLMFFFPLLSVPQNVPFKLSNVRGTWLSFSLLNESSLFQAQTPPCSHIIRKKIKRKEKPSLS